MKKLDKDKMIEMGFKQLEDSIHVKYNKTVSNTILHITEELDCGITLFTVSNNRELLFHMTNNKYNFDSVMEYIKAETGIDFRKVEKVYSWENIEVGSKCHYLNSYSVIGNDKFSTDDGDRNSIPTENHAELQLVISQLMMVTNWINTEFAESANCNSHTVIQTSENSLAHTYNECITSSHLTTYSYKAHSIFVRDNKELLLEYFRLTKLIKKEYEITE